MALLTRDGRIPKKKWIVIKRTGGRIVSRHQFKSAAMDKALSMHSRTGNLYAVCVIAMDFGKPALYEEWVAGPKSFTRR